MGLIINGVDLKSEYNFVTRSVTGRGIGGVAHEAITMPRVDGSVPSTRRFNERTLSVRGVVWGRNPSEALQKKSGLLSFLAQAAFEEVEIKFPDTGRKIYARLASDMVDVTPIGPIYSANAYDIVLTFVAFDPFFYSEQKMWPLPSVALVNNSAPMYLVSPKRAYLKREPAVEMEPVTLINLAGRYGDFTVDSNLDGLADGWTQANVTSRSLQDGLQKITYSGTGTGSVGAIYITLPLPAGHRFFVRVIMRRKIEIAPSGADYANLFVVSSSSLKAVFWPYSPLGVRELYASGAQNSSSSTCTVYLRPFGWVTSTDDKSAEVYYDKFAFYDLTLMGPLPKALQYYLNRYFWSDLATNSEIEAIDGRRQTGTDWLAELLPFCNSVATAGYAWGEETEWVVSNMKGNFLGANWRPVSVEGEKAYIVSSADTQIVRASRNKVIVRVGNNDAGVGQVVRVVRGMSYSFVCRNLGSRALTLRATEYFHPDHASLSMMAGNSYSAVINPGAVGWLDFTPQSHYVLVSLETSGTLEAEIGHNEAETLKISTELWKIGEHSDTLLEDAGTLKKIERCKRSVVTTDGAGSISLSQFLPGSKCVVVNNSTGQVKILDANTVVTTDWANTSVTVIYCVNQQELKTVAYRGELKLEGANLLQCGNAVLMATGLEKHLEG